MDYPLRFADQLRAHLQALRKKRGLTQAQAGSLVGVSQARIAEIEANPGAVGFEQLMKLLAALGASISLRDEDEAPVFAAPASAELPDGDRRAKDRNAVRAYGRMPSPASLVAQEQGAEPAAAAPSPPEPHAPRPAADGPAPTVRGRFAATPRKGSW
ncbi:helix-turn-helix domain-containing protein [Variovorax sp. DAIF25]|uniref:helix-turn-helix domain-containing protein n=1 Tax=Variovorax sp. DAIF25 TaxID=3080983 RepID=UPI003D6BB6B2